MKILELSSDPPGFPGGMGRTVQILRDELTQLGHQVSTLSPIHRIGELKISGIVIKDFSEFDLVHVHGPTPMLSDVIVFNASIKSLVLTYHGDVEWLSKTISQGYLSLHRLLHNRSKTRRVIVHNRAYLARLGPLSSKAVVVQQHGPPWAKVDAPTKVRDLGDFDHFRVLYVGQFRPFKGLNVLAKAATLCPSMRFVVAGSGYSLPKDLINGTISNVELVERPSDQEIRRLYSEAHVICLPSINTTEAYGMSLIEGALAGAIPVGSDLPGVALNVSTLGGRVFPPGSSGGLASVLSELSKVPQAWQALSHSVAEAARHYCESNGPRQFALAHERIFKELVP